MRHSDCRKGATDIGTRGGCVNAAAAGVIDTIGRSQAASTAGDNNPQRQRPTGSNEGSGAGQDVSGTTSSGRSGSNRALRPKAAGAEMAGGHGAGGSGISGAIGKTGAPAATEGHSSPSPSGSAAAMSSNAAASTSSTTGMKRRQP